jgi:hypothetical protein
MDTSERDPVEIDQLRHANELDVPTGIITHEPERAEPGAERVWPQASGKATPTYLHAGLVVAAASGYGWFLLAFWAAFWNYGYMMLAMAVATLISVTMPGLMAAGGGGGRNVTQWERPWHSFQEFLSGHVEVWGARVSGKDAFIQLATMSWLLAGLATAFAIIVALERTT